MESPWQFRFREVIFVAEGASAADGGSRGKADVKWEMPSFGALCMVAVWGAIVPFLGGAGVFESIF